MLLLPHPKRLSTDIDIVVDPGTDISDYIKRASEIFPFKAMEEQERVGRNNIVKRHFKFTYDSPIRREPLYILLDVLFEENHYEKVVEKAICNELLLTEGDDITVRIPSIDCVLGDKLTAFAPYTTGIPIRKNKDLEVIKQFYDVSTLLNHFENYEDVRKTYFAISETELAYRGNEHSSREALKDTIRAAVCIGSRGKSDGEDFKSYLQGTRDISNHIYERGFSMEVASLMAPRVIYMASCLLTGESFVRDFDIEALRTDALTQEDLLTMKSIRKARTDDFGYLVLADRILSQYRLGR